jgi:hypothetical protein
MLSNMMVGGAAKMGVAEGCSRSERGEKRRVGKIGGGELDVDKLSALHVPNAKTS